MKKERTANAMRALMTKMLPGKSGWFWATAAEGGKMQRSCVMGCVTISCTRGYSPGLYVTSGGGVEFYDHSDAALLLAASQRLAEAVTWLKEEYRLWRVVDRTTSTCRQVLGIVSSS